MSDFKAFLLRGNVIDLAVGVIIGAAFGTVIQAFVKDLMTPLIAAIVGQPDFSGLYFTINSSHFKYGDFFNAVIAFVIIAAVVYYFVVLPYSRFRARFEPKKPDEAAQCTECLSSIPKGARRCPFCTSPQPIAS
jgi:large conductance mechanosensitive channel